VRRTLSERADLICRTAVVDELFWPFMHAYQLMQTFSSTTMSENIPLYCHSQDMLLTNWKSHSGAGCHSNSNNGMSIFTYLRLVASSGIHRRAGDHRSPRPSCLVPRGRWPNIDCQKFAVLWSRDHGLETRLECTRVHVVQVSVLVSRFDGQGSGLGLETWRPRRRPSLGLGLKT